MVESGQDFLDLAAIRFHDERLARVINVHIAENPALRVQQESIHPVSGGEIANIIRDHAVQPAHAIAAGKRNSCAEAEVINSAAAPSSAANST